MEKMIKKGIRRFHQAKWDEPIIFDLNSPGERGILPPRAEKEIVQSVGDGFSALPEGMRRKEVPALPELGQMKVLRHFLRLSQENLGADFNVDIGQGTCTMKYNPKINDRLATLPGVTQLHPMQDEDTVQGILQILHETDLFLRAVSGMDRFSLQTGGGSQALYSIASVIRQWVDSQGLQDKKDEIITTIFSHPCNAAAPKMKGFKIVTIYPDKEGRPDWEALKAAVSERTAALLITNPEDVGIYNPRIREFTDLVHSVGGLCSYDQANLNGIMGMTRAKEAGFDLCFFNLHKTFGAPHGCGGPGSGAIGALDNLAPFLPGPLVDHDAEKGCYVLRDQPEGSVARIKDFYGTIPVILRAYAWIRALGAEGLKEAARVAVLNNNYVFRKVLKIRGASAPYAEGEHRMEQVRYSWEKLMEETGVGTHDVTQRIFDFGMHLWSSHEPFIVPEPFTIEPTESYARDELDEYLQVLEHISSEAYEDPEKVKTAPHCSTIHTVDHDYLDDPEKWAMTWRSYRRKFDGYFEPAKA